MKIKEKPKLKIENYNNSNETELKKFPKARGQYLCGRAKPRSITLNITH